MGLSKAVFYVPQKPYSTVCFLYRGVEWSGVEWNGVELSGVEWSGEE